MDGKAGEGSGQPAGDGTSPAAGTVPPQPQILSTREIQQKLEENALLIRAIVERQNLNDLSDCLKFQQQLEKNLKELASLADGSATSGGALPKQE